MAELKEMGVNYIAPPTWMLVTLDEGGIVPSELALQAKEAGLVDDLQYRTDFDAALREKYADAEFDRGYGLPDHLRISMGTDAEMDAYRAPFSTPGDDRLPTLAWPRELPIDGQPADVVEIVGRYAVWLAAAPVRKLFINAEPGAILVGAPRETCRQWPNQQEVTVPGIHFIQEDSAREIGAALAAWYAAGA